MFLSVAQENRINYNGRDYKAAFADERSKEALKESEEQLSLFDLVAVQKKIHLLHTTLLGCFQMIMRFLLGPLV